MAHRTAARRSLALLRLTVRLAALAVLVAGVPALLLRVGTLPQHVPSLAEAREALMAPDDGSLLFTTLTVAAWIAWLWLLVPLLVELIAALAHHATPRLPGMATSQRLAAYLLGGILLASPAAVAAAATPAVAASVTLDHTTPAPVSTSTESTGHAAAAGPAQEHHVAGEGVVVYDVAEQRLGDGLRWRDLAHLNPDLHITGPSSELPTGTTLTLPADAHPTTTAASASRAAGNVRTQSAGSSSPTTGESTTEQAPHSTYTVQAGDTLWDISEDQQGDPTRYTEIAEANPDVIKDPDLIYPGEHLSIPDQAHRSSHHTGSHDTDGQQNNDDRKPGDGTATAPPAPPRASDGEAGTPEQEATPAPATSNPAQEEGDRSPATKAPEDLGGGVPSQAAPTPPGEEPTEAGGQMSAAPHTPAPPGSVPSAGHGHSRASGDSRQESSGPAVSVTTMALGAGAFVAAGMLLMLRRRRTVQQRRRRSGRRIPMPDGRAAATEHGLRCMDAIQEVDFLDAALRTLAHHCTETERPLPELAAVQLGSEGALLHLADTELPVPLPPFTATENNPQVWWCPADTGDLADATRLEQMDAPYPALVALGDDTAGALLLVDLERFGAVHLTGPTRLPVLRALGTSLAVSPLSTDLEIAVAGEHSAPGLSLIDTRVTPYTTLAEAADVVRAHHCRQHTALAGSDSPDLSAARAADTVDELWPMIVLADLDSCPDPHTAEQLAEVLQQQPHTATAIITSGHTPTKNTETVWILDTDDEAHPVPDTRLHCRLVAFSDEEYTDVIESAMTANTETDVAPDQPSPPPVTLTKPDAQPTHSTEPAPAGTAPAGTAPSGREPGSLLARLADLDDTSPTTLHLQNSCAPAAEDRGDHTAPEATPATEPEHPSASQASATSPSRTALPTTTATITRVNTRLPQPPTPAAPAAPAAPATVTTRQEPASTTPDDVPAPEDERAAAAPMVRVLGPVDVSGAAGHIDSNRRTVATELVSWLALRPDGATRHELDDVIAPGGRVASNTRNARVREARNWLTDTYYPKLNEQPDSKHRLAGVTSDWHQFQDLTTRATHLTGPQTGTLLRRALELVRGRPFTGIPPRRYTWAENLTQNMISAIVDTADDLAAHCLNTGDPQGALWAAGRGLDTGREREILWRHRFEALAQLDAHDELEAAIQQLNQYLLDADLPMERATEDTIRRLDAVRH